MTARSEHIIEITPSRALIKCGWSDLPHLTEKDKREVLAGTPLHLRGAVSRGDPSQGAGAVYRTPFADLEVDPFVIPAHWRRCFALDVGWRITAALWLAHDPGADVVYAFTEHYRAHGNPSDHVAAIKARGEWIPGVIDPASRQRTPIDGQRLYDIFTGPPHNLKLTKAKNEVESGIVLVDQRMTTGRFKVFRHACPNFQEEYGMYRRKMDEHQRGVIVKASDHLMDCGRYGIASGLDIAVPQPSPQMSGRHNPKNVGDRRVGY